MTISLAEQHDLAVDMNFVNRVRQAGCTIALEVMAETEVNYSLYQKRESLARQFIASPEATAKRLAFTLATASPNVDQATINDGALLTFIRNNWNKLSGYNPNAPEQPV